MLCGLGGHGTRGDPATGLDGPRETPAHILSPHLDVIPSPAETVRKNPNATLAGSLTVGSALVVFVADTLGASLTSTQAVVAGGIVTTVGLWIGRAGAKCAAIIAKRGIVGLWRALLHGGSGGDEGS